MSRLNDILYPRSIINFSRSFTAAYLLVFNGVFPLNIILNVIGFGIRIKGRHNLPEKEAILISNHVLYLDPSIIACAIYPKRAYFSVMEETFSMPLLGVFIRFLGAFPLPKRNPLPIVLPKIRKALERQLIHFFPEGKLYPFNQRIKRFKDGAFYLAYRLNAPVIPMTTVLRYRRIGRLKLPFLPPRITIVIGKPVSPSSFDNGKRTPREVAHSLSHYMRSLMQKTIDKHLSPPV